MPVVAKKGKKGKAYWREQYLFKRLEEIDREMANEERKAKMKRDRAVERARMRKGAGSNQPSILNQFRKMAANNNTKASNRPSKVTLVATGQSNRSSSTSPVMGVCWRQDEHPMSKGGPEGVDESCGVMEESQPNILSGGSRQDTTLTVPVPGYDVTVPGMYGPTVGDSNNQNNLDDMRKKVCVAQLSVKNMCNVSEQDIQFSQNLIISEIAKPVTRKFASIKPEDIQGGSSPLKRKYKHKFTENIHLNACNLVTKQTEGAKYNLLESESESPAKRRKVGWGQGC